MRFVVADPEEKITVEQLCKELFNDEKLTIVYKVKSDNDNYAFFSRSSHGKYGFRNHAGLSNKMTFICDTMEESLNLAIKNGKQLLVFDIDSLNELYRF